MPESHAFKFGVNFIHEPVLSGAFAATAEQFTIYPVEPRLLHQSSRLRLRWHHDSSSVLLHSANFAVQSATRSRLRHHLHISLPPATAAFSQNVQRLAPLCAGFVARFAPSDRQLRPALSDHVRAVQGLRTKPGRQSFLRRLLAIAGIPVAVPHDYRKQFAPRLGIAYSPGDSEKTVIRAGFGMYFNDLAQNGWAAAFQAVNPNSVAPPSLIDPNYKTPYAHACHCRSAACFQRALDRERRLYASSRATTGIAPITISPTCRPSSAPTTAPATTRSCCACRATCSKRFNLTANYTLSRPRPGDALLGELFDYVNGVCDPLNAFAPGDYGPSGEDVRHRFVLAGTLHIPGGFELTTLTQAESARPFTITNARRHGRISVNGAYLTSLDEFRGTPYIQVDLRVSRPIKLNERWQIYPFAEFFNLFNRNNPGANFVGTIALLPVSHARYGTTETSPPSAPIPRSARCDRARHQPEAAGDTVRRFGRFLRPGHHGWNSVCRAAGRAGDILSGDGDCPVSRKSSSFAASLDWQSSVPKLKPLLRQNPPAVHNDVSMPVVALLAFHFFFAESTLNLLIRSWGLIECQNRASSKVSATSAVLMNDKNYFAVSLFLRRPKDERRMVGQDDGTRSSGSSPTDGRNRFLYFLYVEL